MDGRVTANTGGISEGDPDAGTGKSDEDSVGIHERTISVADRVGAGLVTAFIVVGSLSAVYFMAV